MKRERQKMTKLILSALMYLAVSTGANASIILTVVEIPSDRSIEASVYYLEIESFEECLKRVEDQAAYGVRTYPDAKIDFVKNSAMTTFGQSIVLPNGTIMTTLCVIS